MTGHCLQRGWGREGEREGKERGREQKRGEGGVRGEERERRERLGGERREERAGGERGRGEERERGRGVKKVWRRPRLGDGPIISNMPRFSSMCFILMPVESSLPAPSLSYSSMPPNLPPSSVGNLSCTRPFRHGSERHSVLKAVLTMLRSSS